MSAVRVAESRSELRYLLKEATAGAHARVETSPRMLRLLDPGLTVTALRELLERLETALHGVEAHLAHCALARAYVREVGPMDWEASTQISREMLGERGPVPARDWPEGCSADELLGRAYVLEGMALGGAVINRALTAHSWVPAPLPIFSRPPQRWKRFIRFLGAQSPPSAAVTAAAVDMFERVDREMRR